jgi:tetratricopeptide (TPR) repeat protein
LTYARQHAHVGEAYLLAGRREDAARLAATALEAARAQKQRGQEAAALWLSAEIDACERKDARAEVDYRHAMTLAEGIGLRPLVAHCHFGLGKLYRRSGNRSQGQEHLATAAAMYRGMGMTYWLTQVEA